VQIAAGPFQVWMILYLVPLLLGQILWPPCVSPTTLPGNSPHQFHIWVKTTDNLNHICVELQWVIKIKKGPRTGMLHDQYVLFLADPPCEAVSATGQVGRLKGILGTKLPLTTLIDHLTTSISELMCRQSTNNSL